MILTTALAIIDLVVKEVPQAISLFNQWKSSGQTLDEYIADAEVRDKSASDAADAEIAKDSGE